MWVDVNFDDDVGCVERVARVHVICHAQQSNFLYVL